MSPSKRSSNRVPLALLLFLAGASLLLSACRPADQLSEPGASGGKVRTPSKLVILHTNDTWGYYDPCG